MSISYEDIKNKRIELEMKHNTRQDFLRKSLISLFNEYKDSLILPAKSWKDANGVDQPYVTCGEINSKGLYESKPVAAFRTNDDHIIMCLISTVVDDSLYGGGAHYLVAVSLRMDGGRLIVDVGEGTRQIIVSSPEENGAYFEVCAAIKAFIMHGLSDSRLD
jgi:hypothetical protein